MIDIEINPDLDAINWNRIRDLFQIVEWGTRDVNEIKDAFVQSSYVCIAMDGDDVVGFGRSMDDGRYYAMLVDVVIDPRYQGKGIGKSIVKTLRTSLKGYEFITLTAAPQKHEFYSKIGWERQKSAFIYPKDEQQRKDHCE